jgi:hypothetical protein
MLSKQLPLYVCLFLSTFTFGAPVKLPNWNIQPFSPSGNIDPNVSQTAAGINNSGTVVGKMTIQSAGRYVWLAYVLDANGTQTDLGDPEAESDQKGTWPNAINNSADAAGGFYCCDTKIHAFTLSDGQFQTMNLPGVNDGTPGTDYQDVVALGINSNLTIVGNTEQGHAYIQTSASSFQLFDCPGAWGTQLVAINDQGIMLGSWQDTNYAWHPFWTNGFGCNALPEVPGSLAARGSSDKFSQNA